MEVAMPTELIGEVGTEGAEREWIAAECELAIKHLKKVCGEPPPKMKLQWQEHELGNYPMIVLSWEDAMRGAPSDYIARCESALTAYEYGEEPPRWSLPALDVEDEEEDSDPPDPDMPPEPRPDASFSEVQQYLSSLIEYAVGASSRARAKPRLVDSDEGCTDNSQK
jgi:hypothetical protein